MAARLLAAGHDKTLFFEETEGGHGGRGDRKPQAMQVAMKYVFLKRNLDPRPELRTLKPRCPASKLGAWLGPQTDQAESGSQ